MNVATRCCVLVVVLGLAVPLAKGEEPEPTKTLFDSTVTTGRGLAAGARPRVVWEYAHEGGLKSEACHIVVADDTVLFTQNFKLHALQLADGKPRWIADGYGHPLVEGGLVFVADSLKDGCEFKALSLAEGRTIWERTGDGLIENGWTQIRAASKPVAAVRGECVYFAGFGTSLYCFDKASGKVLWKNKAHAEFFPAVPILADDAVLLMTLDSADPKRPNVDRFDRNTHDASIYAFDDDTGAIRWRVKLADLGGHHAAAIPCCVDGVVYIADHGDDGEKPKFWALDARTGKHLWNVTLSLPHIETTVTLYQGKAYLSGEGGKIEVVDLAQRKIVGQIELPGVEEVQFKVISKPDNILYAATWGANQPTGGTLFGIDLTTRQTRFQWNYPEANVKEIPHVHGIVALQDGRVIHNAVSSKKIVCFSAEK